MDGSNRLLKIVLAVVIILAVVASIIVGVYCATVKKDDATPTDGETEITTAVADGKYSAGEYVVTCNGSLRLRKDHDSKSESLVGIPQGTSITISMVYKDPDAEDENLAYWGYTTYQGFSAWVAMAYITPAEEVTTKEAVTAESTTAEITTAETTTSAEVTTAAEITTAAATTVPATTEPATTASQSTSGANSSTGTYVVTADEYLNMRDTHSTSGTSVVRIDKDVTIIITEVWEDTSATDSTLRYWGKTTYYGTEGWVCMYYLQKVQ